MWFVIHPQNLWHALQKVERKSLWLDVSYICSVSKSCLTLRSHGLVLQVTTLRNTLATVRIRGKWRVWLYRCDHQRQCGFLLALSLVSLIVGEVRSLWRGFKQSSGVGHLMWNWGILPASQEKLRPPKNSHVNEPSWKWLLLLPTHLHMTATPAFVSCAPSSQSLSQNLKLSLFHSPDPWMFWVNESWVF